MFHPDGATPVDDQWLELKNVGDEDFDFAGVAITRGMNFFSYFNVFLQLFFSLIACFLLCRSANFFARSIPVETGTVFGYCEKSFGF